MKCPICSYDDYGTGDSAHHCSAEIQPCPYCGGKEKCDSAYPHPRHNFTKAGALVAPVPAPGPVLTWQDRMKIDMRPWAQDAAMQGEIADLRAALATRPTAEQWISVEDQMPPEYEFVLTIGSKRVGMAVMACDQEDGWQIKTSQEWRSAYPPTYWMPLPAAPSVKSTEGA